MVLTCVNQSINQRRFVARHKSHTRVVRSSVLEWRVSGVHMVYM